MMRTLTAFVVAGAALLVALLVVGQAIDDMALGALLGLSAAVPLALLVAMSMDRSDPDAPDRPRVVVVQPARPALPMPARQRVSRRDRVAAVFAGHRVGVEVETHDGLRFDVVSRNGQDVAGFVQSHHGEFGLAVNDDDAVIEVPRMRMKIAAILSVAVFVAGAVLVNILDNAAVAIAMGIVSGSAASLPIALRMRQTSRPIEQSPDFVEEEDDDEEAAVVLAA